MGADEGPSWALVIEAGRGLGCKQVTECSCPTFAPEVAPIVGPHSVAATGPGSDSIGSTAGHAADTVVAELRAGLCGEEGSGEGVGTRCRGPHTPRVIGRWGAV